MNEVGILEFQLEIQHFLIIFQNDDTLLLESIKYAVRGLVFFFQPKFRSQIEYPEVFIVKTVQTTNDEGYGQYTEIIRIGITNVESQY